MMETPQTKEFYDFGEFRLDVPNRLLRLGQETVDLNLKEFEVLFFLVENAGRVVTKDNLLDAIWKDLFIEEGTLTQNISRLRKKLEAASGSGSKIIETLPKRGYRFLPTVTAIETGNTLLIEEQIIQHIRIEETLTLSDAATFGHRDAAKEILALPNVTAPPRRAVTAWLLPALGLIALTAIGLVVYQNFIKKSDPKTIFAGRIMPFAGLSGREESPSFSPDGKQIAFVWNGGDEAGNFDVYVKLVGSGEPIRLTKNVEDDLNPAFSPDGSQIAFVRNFPTYSELFLIPALGGAERKVATLRSTRSSVSFAPDGKTLAVQDSDADNLQKSIYLIDIGTGDKKRLTSPPEYADDERPGFSPDGNKVVFTRSTGSVVQELFFIATGGGEPHQLTFDRAWIDGAVWMSDGEHIIFASMRGSNNQTKLWRIAATGGEPELIETGGKNLGSPAVAPDGGTIAFVEDTRDMNIWSIALDKTPARYAFRKFIASSRNDNSPQFSPDGKRIVFASDRTANYEIWIADADGSKARQLSDLKNSPTGSPRFSPDGRLVVFDAQVAGNADIFVVPADGGQIRRLTDADSFDFMPSWSSDGRSIYFASNRSGDGQIWKMPAAGGEAVQITMQGGRESYESPDGSEIYFSKAEGVTGLWRIPSGGGEEIAVPELAQAGYWRSWTVTRLGVYFVVRAASSPYRIAFYDFATRRVKDVATAEQPPVWVFPSLSVATDGKTVLYTQNDQNASSILLAKLGN